jgi:outer membrane lipopolysaccharide assembly protein LptE/RlpB
MQRAAGYFLCLAVFCAVILTGGCGYRFSQGGENIAPDIRQVYVDTFRNDTSEAYVESYLRNGFIDQFRTSNRFRITDEKETADAVLTGGIKTIVVPPLATDQYDRATENRLLMVVEIRFQERRSGNVIYLNPALAGEQSFLAEPGNVNLGSMNKSAALQKLSVDLSEKGFRLLMSGF